MVWLTFTVTIFTLILAGVLKIENIKHEKRMYKKYVEEWEMCNECKDYQK